MADNGLPQSLFDAAVNHRPALLAIGWVVTRLSNGARCPCLHTIKTLETEPTWGDNESIKKKNSIQDLGVKRRETYRLTCFLSSSFFCKTPFLTINIVLNR